MASGLQILANQTFQKVRIRIDVFEHVQKKQEIEACGRATGHELDLGGTVRRRGQKLWGVIHVPADDPPGGDHPGELLREPGIPRADIKHRIDGIEVDGAGEYLEKQAKADLFPGMPLNRPIGKFDEVHALLLRREMMRKGLGARRRDEEADSHSARELARQSRRRAV
jgi:hypothetical protein